MKSSKFFLIALLSTTIAVAQNKNVTIDDICTNYTFYEKVPEQVKSSTDGIHFTKTTDDTKIEQFEYATGAKTATLIDLSEIKDCPIEWIDSYQISNDGMRILIRTNTEQVYRRSFTAEYYIYDVKYKSLEPISEHKPQQMAELSPNGQMVAFVFENDIYIKKLAYNSESAVTTDGKINKIINGIPDWVYEEEFSFNKAFEWSNDSQELAYIRFDETNVKEYSFPLYKASYPEYTDNATYPGQYTYKYPKAGQDNSTVSVNVFNVRERTTKTMNVGDDKNIYIPRIKWTLDAGKLAIVKMNRRQNQLDILVANTASTVCNTLFTDRNKCYIEEVALNNIIFLPNGKNFVYLSEKDGYSHIYLYSMNGALVRQLTKGSYDVINILGYNEKYNTLFYQAAKKLPTQREIYSISLDGKTDLCLTKRAGTNNAIFSNGCKYFINNYSDTKTPLISTICDSKGNTLRTIEDNKELVAKIKYYNIEPKEFISFTTNDGVELNGWIIKPQNFDTSKQYPVLMVQYSGPNSQEVLDRWDIGWEQTLASQGYVVACFDPRGTGARGESFRKCTYQKLGKYESDDQISAANYLAALPYIDANRIGIWGWSFGGFMSSLCMCKSDVFKMGIAVAPVINWRYYDTIYTERYMRTPSENPSGYDDNSPIYHADNLSGRLFLIHGSADDNVHYQNQMEFVDKLVNSGKQFDMFTYPNRNHSIYGGPVRQHLYTMMLNYVKTNL